MENYGIRVRGAEEPFVLYDNPVSAKLAYREVEQQMGQPIDRAYEIVERVAENIYESKPDNRVYITGVVHKWVKYQD